MDQLPENAFRDHMVSKSQRNYEKESGTNMSNRGDKQKKINVSELVLIICIVAGNVASGVTTYWGLEAMISSSFISLCITISVQGVMCATAFIVVRRRKISHAGPLLVLYSIPMIVSILFNYVYFHGKFSVVSERMNSNLQEQIEIDRGCNQVMHDGQHYVSEIQGALQKELFKFKADADENKLAMEEELTVRGTPTIGAGKHYREYRKKWKRAQANYNQVYQLKEKISNIFKQVVQKLDEKKMDSPREAWALIVEIGTICGKYSEGFAVPSLPGKNLERDVFLGENHPAFEALRALGSPSLFDIMCLGLGILMDFVIFSWVFFRVVFHVSYDEVAR